MDVILKVLKGAKEGAKVAVKKDKFLIGRSQKCHLCIGSSAISRKHCVITRKENTVTIKDLGSRNGTLVNDLPISEETKLKTGDELTIGPLHLQVSISTGINNRKHPKVHSVAEAAERTASSRSKSFAEEDITQWLLDAESSSTALTETQTIQTAETHAGHSPQPKPETTEEKASAPEASADEKKKPGKLPPTPQKSPTKDSREAAVEALRNWSRRH